MPSITLLPACNPGPYTGSGNNTYLLQGREATLVDAGVGEPRHLDAIARALGGASLARVIVTHAHSDHASGVEAITGRWPQVEFMKWPWPGRDAHYRVRWTAVANGDEVSAGDTHLTVVHTPGHAPDHICLLDRGSGVLFTGDLVVKGGTVVVPPTRGGCLAQYLASLRRVLDLEPRRLLPAHGPAIDDPSSLIQAYLAHRREREQQVIEALTAGLRTPERMVDRIYADLQPELVEAARESVLAHLLKLESEGRAVHGEDGTWRMR